jgi:hypothetical protein
MDTRARGYSKLAEDAGFIAVTSELVLLSANSSMIGIVRFPMTTRQKDTVSDSST